MAERVEHVMGMPVRVDVRDAGAAAGARDAVFAWLRFVDATFSTYDPRSEISRISRGALALADAHPLVREVLDRCEALRARDRRRVRRARRGSRRRLPLDPSGLVKGWAVERAAALLEARGRAPLPRRRGRRRRRCAAGRGASGSATRAGATASRPCWCCTTARSRRPAPTSAGRTSSTRAPAGRRAARSRSRSSARTSGTADAYATAAFALGDRGPAWTAALDGYEAMTIVPGDRVLATPGFLRHCPGGSAARSLEPA